MRMQNKGVIITGGASGIGAATAKRMLEEGARVVIADLNADAGEALAAQLGGGERARFVRTDVADEASVTSLFDAAESFCGVDAVFSNAGIGHQALAVDYESADWRRVIDINLTGVFLMAREAMQRMRGRGGSIVNCSSILGHVGQTQTAAYSAAKAAVINLTRTLALEGAPMKIRVNSVSPGYIDTPLLSEMPADVLNFLTSLHPLGRLGRSEEVANAVLFLASDEASFTTGSDLLVDGGFMAGKS
jgi:NAD(P)-dependent dehydrogenase (short-subunit alcohol dehydrogenase family)